MQKISTSDAPAAIGPYSQAIEHGGFIYTSGQIPLLPQTGEVVKGGIKEQTTQAITNLQAVLKQAGSALENVIKTTCFLTDMKDFADFNEVYGSFFINKPARSCVQVSALPKGVSVEIEAVAVLV
jgi:2-iminobutanoate/2-iminopropanoate deaminase